MYRAGKRVIDRDNHEQAHKHKERQYTCHQDLGRQILGAEKERKHHRQYRADVESEP